MRTRVFGRTMGVAAALVCAASAAGAPLDTGTPSSVGAIRFVADVAVAPSADGGGVIRITYSLNYDALPFLRTDDGYVSRYEVTAIVYDSDGRQVTGDSWRRTVAVATYEETNDRRPAVADVLEFPVGPGRYALKLEVASLDTRATGRIERSVRVPEMVPGELTFGTMTFESRESRPGLADTTVLNPTRVYGEDDPTAVVRIPVYGAPGTSYVLELSVLDARGIPQKHRTDTIEQTGFRTEYVYEFTVLDLEVGAHELKAELRPAGDGAPSTARSRFRVVTSPMSWGKDPEKMIAQISYVATRDEIERLTSVPPERRGPLWDEFWAAHDPEPATEVNEFKTEFLRRLGYANAQFKSVIEGWQTDMGRIYIQHGEPDDIESQPVGQMLNAWEVWYYYNEHTKYVFIDREGFGEYVLYETDRI